MPADSQQVSALVERRRGGDEAAREELIAAAMGRLERLARKMLKGFPRVRRWEDTGDVLNEALIRLDRALRAVVPGSSRDFFGLAAEQMRRVLLDLARHYNGPRGLGHNHHSGDGPGEAGAAGPDPADGSPDPAELDRWAAFHAAVERLPAAEREVFMLKFYHNWTHARIAELFAVDLKTVSRRQAAAVVHLNRLLGGDLPTG